MKITIIRSKRKTLSLQIKNNGELIIKAPLQMKEEKIWAFVKEKEGWINKSLAKIKAHQEFSKTFDFENNVYLLGKAQDFANYNLLAGVTNKKNKESILCHEEIYKDFAKSYLPKKSKLLSDLTGLKYKDVKLSNSTRCWGTYSKDGKMRLNWKLVALPEEIINYVIIHELCHSKQLNHSPKFWTLVKTFEPNYKKLRELLKLYSFIISK